MLYRNTQPNPAYFSSSPSYGDASARGNFSHNVSRSMVRSFGSRQGKGLQAHFARRAQNDLGCTPERGIRNRRRMPVTAACAHAYSVQQAMRARLGRTRLPGAKGIVNAA